MSVQDIEKAIEALPDKEVHELADWIAERKQQLWDKQLAQDLKAGRLNALIAEARDDIRKNNVRSL